MTEIRLACDFAGVAGTSFRKFERIYHTNYIWFENVLWNSSTLYILYVRIVVVPNVCIGARACFGFLFIPFATEPHKICQTVTLIDNNNAYTKRKSNLTRKPHRIKLRLLEHMNLYSVEMTDDYDGLCSFVCYWMHIMKYCTDPESGLGRPCLFQWFLFYRIGRKTTRPSLLCSSSQPNWGHPFRCSSNSTGSWRR